MNAPNKVAVIEQQGMAITPMSMLNMAVSQGADLDKLEKLMALQERWEANEARKAFSEALTAFKAEPLTIDKDKHVKFGNTEYNHATLGNVCNIIGAALSKHGLSYRWNTEQNEGKIKVSCVLMHVKGHSESISLEAVADTSGAKNGIQAIGSTVSYLQRYTLLAITGTATQEQDDDGRGAGVKMNAGVLADYLAAIDAAENMSALGKAYIPAIEIASVAKDIAAMDMLNEAKLERIEKIKGAAK
ncbi:MAG: ERF family protein [Candidatus Brocadiaceae bacterium]|nr:ERF family protein [Candidatus Brocadiaceae bacterium]